MSTNIQNENKNLNQPNKERYRQIDTATVEAEIKLIADEIPNEICVMRSLKAVSQDLLRLEFKV